MERNNQLAVAEAFYSIQGEGQTMGKPAFFLRLAGCNLLCGGHGTDKDGLLHDGATWRCDSIEVWQKGVRMHFGHIVEMFGGVDFFSKLKQGAHLIITGGEPLIQQFAIYKFAEYIIQKSSFKPIIEIETNGTITPIPEVTEIVDYWNVSPKLSNSGEKISRRVNKSALHFFKKLGVKTIFKFVISEYSDLLEAKDLVDVEGTSTQVWLMPAGATQEELSKTAPLVAEYSKRYGYSYSHRLHISIWNQKTGV